MRIDALNDDDKLPVQRAVLQRNVSM